MLRKWMKLIKGATEMFGKGLDVVDGLEEGLRECGFVGVGRDVYEVCFLVFPLLCNFVVVILLMLGT